MWDGVTDLLETLQQVVDEMNTAQVSDSAEDTTSTFSWENPADTRDIEWKEYLLDEIKAQEAERLQEKYDLEQDEYYTPKELIEELFLEFRGDMTEFE